MIVVLTIILSPAMYAVEPFFWLYEDPDFKDTICDVRTGQNFPRLDAVGFGDQADSMKWQLPRGTCVVLFEHDNYKKPRLILRGCGEHKNLNNLKFGDDLDSLFWSSDRILNLQEYRDVPRLGSI